jgi:hypothetical protein
MNWFKRMIGRWAYEYRDTPDDVANECYPSPKLGRGQISTISGRASIDSDPTLQFKVYSAVGGKIVEFTRYDRQKDRADHQVYIISKDEDFGEKIAKISTLEVLR